MPRKSSVPLHRHTLRLYKGDYDELGRYYPASGANRIIRELVRKHLRTIQASASESGNVPADLPAPDLKDNFGE